MIRAAALVSLTLLSSPAFAAGQDAACAGVVKTLELLNRVVPTLRGDANALPASFLLMVATSAETAYGQVQYVSWTAASAQALAELGQGARVFMNGGMSPGQATLDTFAAQAGTVALEANGICAGYRVPELAAASRS